MNKTPTQQNFREEDWYLSLKDDISSAIIETEEAAKMALVETYLAVGARIVEEIGKRAGYGERIIPTLAEDTGISTSKLYMTVNWARKYEELGLKTAEEFVNAMLPKGKAIAIRAINDAVSPPKGGGEEPEYGSCVLCYQPLKAPLSGKQEAMAKKLK